MDWYWEVLKKYAVFGGRAGRSEYWYFFLFNLIVSLALGVIDGGAGLTFGPGLGVLGLIYALAVFLPSLGVGIRRLHDTNRTGWWFLISVVPIAGFIILLIYFIQEGTAGPNRYGPVPSNVSAKI